jgi:hypothetical protein
MCVRMSGTYNVWLGSNNGVWDVRVSDQHWKKRPAGGAGECVLFE